MTVKVLKGAGKGWRPYRFPPRANVNSSLQASQWGSDPEAIQRAIADGFQEGSEKGYQQGLIQGQEEGQRDGFTQGHIEGVARGREEGRQQGREAFETASQPLDQISQQLQAFMEDFERKRRRELLQLVKKVAQQVIRCELTLHPTQLLNLAEEALAAMPTEQSDVHVLLNPEECNRIKDLAPGRAAAWRLVPDDKLVLGECRIVTAQTEVDIGCQQRLDACVDTLAEHMHLAEG
ncbi:flagellar assembly protein FliH [Cellvibrio sp. QJXJ]|uniref:flagellar assembly protein FliH n=1 Tax=Cellvibrio sp. QJXJ TaxID=2964606 RepID=UPI0021C3F552|nr:flagellar assembly protein FliH [Cellvibrio sp. QJXJ]UUA73954.1 flagellar assembly protein H [Cellvibrio sp. QJXJ]